MKRLLTIVFMICLVLVTTACKTPVPVQEPQAPVENPSDWELFVQKMADENISEGNLHTIENNGFSQEAIMKMTPAEIDDLLSMIRAHADQFKIDTALGVLANPEEAKNDEQFVFCDGKSTARPELIEEWLEAKENSDTCSVWGVYTDESEQFVFALETSNGTPGELFTYRMEGDAVTGRLNALEKTVETDEVYQFIDVAGNTVTIPKTPMEPTTVPAVIYPLGDALGIHAGQVKEFKYEIIGVSEGKELILKNTAAANAAIGLVTSKVAPQESREMNPIVGGEFTRYTLTLLNGDVIVIEDNGMISVNDKRNAYCWESKKNIELPEDAVWTEYAIDPFSGEENPHT